MASRWSFERLKSFSGIPYDDLFDKCEQALRANHLEICRIDKTLGIMEAKRPGMWPSSGHKIFLTVRRDSKVNAIEKLEARRGILGTNISADDMLTERFFRTLREIIQNETQSMIP